MVLGVVVIRLEILPGATPSSVVPIDQAHEARLFPCRARAMEGMPESARISTRAAKVLKQMARDRTRMRRFLGKATSSWRGRLVLGLAALAAIAAGTYAVLVLSTITAPPRAQLQTLPSSSSFAGGTGTDAPSTQRACAGSPRAGSTNTATPDGEWVVAGGETGGFVGYRASEILAFEFVRAPNDAVGRTHSVEGQLTINGQTLTAASVKAKVEDLTSDVGMRDGHISEYLSLRDHPNATFVLAGAVPFGEPAVNQVTLVNATGDLSILDVSHRVTFPLEARWNGDSIDVAGSLTINRADYVMDIPQLLGFRVGEQIAVELSLRFVRAGTDPCSAPLASEKPDGESTPEPSTEAAVAVVLDRFPEGWGELLFAGLPNPPGAAAPQGELYALRGGDHEPTAVTRTTSALEDEPAWSADGQRIAYTVSPPDSPYSLWTSGANGVDAAVLSSASSLRSPSWSPDATTIAAIIDTDTGSNLVLVDLSNGAAETILADAGVIDSPTWSPDGRLAFALLVPGGTGEDIYVADAHGEGLHRLTSDPAYEYQPRWSPDGATIAFVRGGNLWLMDAQGGDQRQITHGLTVDSPTWSPDGQHLAFVIAGTGPLNEGPQRKALWLVDADGSALSNLTFALYQVAHPAWRP